MSQRVVKGRTIQEAERRMMFLLRGAPADPEPPPPADAVLALVAALGGDSAVEMVHDYTSLTDGVVSTWSEYRGGGFAYDISATGSLRPTKDSTGVIFDGVDDELGGALTPRLDTDAGKVLVVIGQFRTGGEANRYAAILVNTDTTDYITLDIKQTTSNIHAAFPLWFLDSLVAGGATVRLAYVGIDATTNARVRVPNTAEQTMTVGASPAGNKRLVLGTYQLGGAGGHNNPIIKTSIVMPSLSAGQLTTIATFAVAERGAVLT